MSGPQKTAKAAARLEFYTAAIGISGMLAGTAHRKLLWEILVILAVNHVIVAVIGYVAGAATPGLSLSQQKPKIVK